MARVVMEETDFQETNPHTSAGESYSTMPAHSFQPQALADLKPGEHAVFRELRGGRGLAGRLTSLGFTPGAELVMTQNYGHGPLLVTIRGTRVALGREESRKIIVEKQ